MSYLIPAGIRSMYVNPCNTTKSKKMLESITGNSVALEEHGLRSRLEYQGFSFDSERDNKSVWNPQDLFFGLNLYSRKLPAFDPNDDLLRDAMNITLSTFGGDASLHAIDDPFELYNSIKPSKNSGFPEFAKKGDVFWRDLRRMRKVNSGSRPFAYPCTAFHRVQHGQSGPKTRLVWGFPQAITLAEARYARPLIEKFLRIQTPMAFGFKNMDLSCRLTPIDNSNVRYGLDMSKFDSSVPSWMIGFAFDVLASWFSFDSEELVRYEKVKRYFIHTPILMPDGNVYRKSVGIPSGSYFTQQIGRASCRERV